MLEPSNLQDYISGIDKHNIHDGVTVQTDTPRRSYDSEINRHDLSDHCQVTTNIKMMHYTNKSPTGNSYYQWKYLPKSFKWKNTSSAKDFISAINTPHIKAKIDYFMSNRFPEIKDGIENANKFLINILCEAAKLSLPTSRLKRVKTHKTKKWFNKSCSKARVLFKQAASKANKYPSETQLIEDKITKLKEFKKVCKSQQKEFWDNRAIELSETNNGKFWDIWKKCDKT